MKCQEIIKELEKIYPLCMAQSWDNSGLQAGRREKEVKKVYVALDADDQAIGHAKEWGADMLITHHPMIFSPIKQVNTDDFTGRRLIELIQSDISYYAMHTNYDVVTMGNLAADMLGLRNTEVLEATYEDEHGVKGFGCVGEFSKKMTLGECGRLVKDMFGLKSVKVFGDLAQSVCRAAVLPGSGKSMVGAALEKKADVMISGDFGHHEGMDAVMQQLAVIDAGHYGLEHIFIRHMTQSMQEIFPGLEICGEPIRNPFQVLV